MQFLDGRTREIAAVDVERVDRSVLLNGLEQPAGRLVLTYVGWLHGRREDQVVRDRDVSLVAVEELAPTLSAVTNLRILDRDNAFSADLFLDPAATRGIGLDVLVHDSAQHLQRVFEWRHRRFLAGASRDPSLKRVDLPKKLL